MHQISSNHLCPEALHMLIAHSQRRTWRTPSLSVQVHSSAVVLPARVESMITCGVIVSGSHSSHGSPFFTLPCVSLCMVLPHWTSSFTSTLKRFRPKATCRTSSSRVAEILIHRQKGWHGLTKMQRATTLCCASTLCFFSQLLKWLGRSLSHTSCHPFASLLS